MDRRGAHFTAPGLPPLASHTVIEINTIRLLSVEAFNCHTLGHLLSVDRLESGYDIRTIQELLGHRDVSTTMIYTHVLNRGGRGVTSPLDQPGFRGGNE
jgi:site-specific recombinase XerD